MWEEKLRRFDHKKLNHAKVVRKLGIVPDSVYVLYYQEERISNYLEKTVRGV